MLSQRHSSKPVLLKRKFIIDVLIYARVLILDTLLDILVDIMCILFYKSTWHFKLCNVFGVSKLIRRHGELI